MNYRGRARQRVAPDCGRGPRAQGNAGPPQVSLLPLGGADAAKRWPWGYSIIQACEIGLLRRFARLRERVDALLGEQRDHLVEHLGRHHRVAERRVAAEHRDVEARGKLLQPVRFLVRVHHGRQQQCVEHRLIEDDAGRIDYFTRWTAGTEFVLAIARSGGQALGMLSKGFDGVAGVMLDHDLSDAPLTSVDAQLSASTLIPLLQRRLPRHVPVLIHSHNLNKPVAMQRALEASGHSVTRLRFAALMQDPVRFSQWMEVVRDNWDPEDH